MSTQKRFAQIADRLCFVHASTEATNGGGLASWDATHLIAELIELTPFLDILVLINKVYIDILFFVCARNPIEMNFP